MTLEGPIGQERQSQESPFHRELFSNENVSNLSREAVTLGKDALNLGKEAAVTITKDAMSLEREAATKVGKDVLDLGKEVVLTAGKDVLDLSKDALAVAAKDAMLAKTGAEILTKDAMNMGKDAAELAKEAAGKEIPGFNAVTKYLKNIAEQFEKYGDKLLMALKPHEHKELNDSINKMGCPMAKLRAALSKQGADSSAKEDGEESNKKSL